MSIIDLFRTANEMLPLNKYSFIIACVVGAIYSMAVISIIKRRNKSSSKIAIAVIAIIMLKPINDCIIIMSSTELGIIIAISLALSFYKEYIY